MANVSKKIPTNTQPTWQADINGKRYEYQSGITADVPDEVAALIDFIDESAPKRDPKAAQRAIEDEVTQIVKDNFAGGVGYEETPEIVMLPETSFEVSESAPQVVLSESFPYTFEIGKYYTVTVDGVTEAYTAVDLDGHIGIASSGEVFSGYGWACVVVENNLVFLSLDESFYGAHAISISKGANIVHKIDSKYIDESSIASSIVSSIDLSSKMDKTNPVGEGSFSLNRKADSTIGRNSFAEGNKTTASGNNSHAEGSNTTASGGYSHAEGYNTTASGIYSHAEGETTTASGDDGAHAEGYQTTASGRYSHTEGAFTTATNDCSHAEGYQTTASGRYSHAEGFKTIAASESQHVQGKWNVEDSNGVYAHIIGGGSSDTDRKNIHTVDWNGNAWYDGNIEGKALIIASSTTGSTKRFKITVDDTGALTATEVTS